MPVPAGSLVGPTYRAEPVFKTLLTGSVVLFLQIISNQNFNIVMVLNIFYVLANIAIFYFSLCKLFLKINPCRHYPFHIGTSFKSMLTIYG